MLRKFKESKTLRALLSSVLLTGCSGSRAEDQEYKIFFTEFVDITPQQGLEFVSVGYRQVDRNGHEYIISITDSNTMYDRIHLLNKRFDLIGTPIRAKFTDINGDGSPDLWIDISRKILGRPYIETYVLYQDEAGEFSDPRFIPQL